MSPLLLIILTLAAISAAVAYLSSAMLKVDKPVFCFKNLPAGFDGFRILHISDLHSRRADKIGVDIWRAAERLDFDMAVITGDIILNAPSQLIPQLEGIKALAARVPVFFVEGNHERGVGKDVCAILSDCGVTILDNKNAKIEKNGDNLEIIGFKDYFRLCEDGFAPDASPAFRALSRPGFKLVLEHQPQLFDSIKHKGELLMLCGHTHGGQVRLPLLPVLFAPGQGLFPKYGFGAYRHEDAVMYISKGIGATVFPLRFYNRPEIALITLKKAG